jgi:hypothetical protein
MQHVSWGFRDDDYMTVESVRDDGEVVIRFTGGHRLRLAVPPALVSHYRRLRESGRSA